MAIPGWSCYRYHTVVHADRGHLAGTANDDGSDSLVGSGPSVVVIKGRVFMKRNRRGILRPSLASRASFDGGEALAAVLRDGDRLSCWRDATAEIGMSVTREGSLVLGLGTLGHAPGSDITIDHDPRVEERELAADIRYVDRPGTHIVWLDPGKPSELEARLRELEGDLTGVKALAIVARTDDWAVGAELSRRTMRHRPGIGPTAFITAAERFSGVEEWLQYGRTLSTERPRDLWMRVRSGSSDCQVPEGTTAAVDRWLVHVLRVYEPGLPGRLSQLGVVAADTGVTAEMLESSTAAIASGLGFA